MRERKRESDRGIETERERDRERERHRVLQIDETDTGDSGFENPLQEA